MDVCVGDIYAHAYGDHRSTENDLVPQEPGTHQLDKARWPVSLQLPSTGTKKHIPPCLAILRGIQGIDLRSSCLLGKHFCQLSYLPRPRHLF